MKKRRSRKVQHSAEFKGVVKKITGKLTSDPQLEEEGQDEMLGLRKRGRSQPNRPKPVPLKQRRQKLNPDPYRRG